MVNLLLLAGGYGSTIVTYLFNSTSSTLAIQSTTTVGENPSWIFKHPANSSILYATNEGWSGQLQSFTVGKDGRVSSPVASVTSGGQSPAHAAYLSSGKIAVMNYNTGDGRIVSTTPDGLGFREPIQSVNFKPASNATIVSHPHQAVEYNGEILVPDLGQDKIFRLTANGSIRGSIPQPQGSGPRHIAIANSRLYTLHELSSTLSLQAISSNVNVSTPVLSTVSILPETRPEGAIYAAAEILIPPATAKFPKRYIYVTNRNVGPQTPEGDTIAIFETIGDRLQLVKQVYTGLTQPRGMEFGPAGKGEEYLAVAGVAGSGGVAIFRRTEGGRNLVEVARNKEVPQRSSFVWLQQ